MNYFNNGLLLSFSSQSLTGQKLVRKISVFRKRPENSEEPTRKIKDFFETSKPIRFISKSLSDIFCTKQSERDENRNRRQKWNSCLIKVLYVVVNKYVLRTTTLAK